jgi:hypothetical protein
MDVDHESHLLHIIDGFLASNPNFQDLLGFRNWFSDQYSRLSNQLFSAIEEKFPFYTLDQMFRTKEGMEALRLLDEQLPAERGEFFRLVAERAWYTIEEDPDEQDRSFGYASLPEFLEFVRREREVYRQKFGR